MSKNEKIDSLIESSLNPKYSITKAAVNRPIYYPHDITQVGSET